MKAEDVRLTELLEGPKQFIVPVFQRDYSWGTKHCLQLWKDIVRVGSDEKAKAHFVGSVVYIAAEETSANITRWLPEARTMFASRLGSPFLVTLPHRDSCFCWSLTQSPERQAQHAAEALEDFTTRTTLSLRTFS